MSRTILMQLFFLFWWQEAFYCTGSTVIAQVQFLNKGVICKLYKVANSPQGVAPPMCG